MLDDAMLFLRGGIDALQDKGGGGGGARGGGPASAAAAGVARVPSRDTFTHG